MLCNHLSKITHDTNMQWCKWLQLQLPGRAPVLPAMRNSLHWLNFPQRVTNTLCLLTYKCLHGLAADYLTRLCVHVATVGGRSRLRSSDDINCSSHRRTRNVTLGLCAFSISGPASWNDLPALLCDPAVTLGTFRQMLKSFLFDWQVCTPRY